MRYASNDVVKKVSCLRNVNWNIAFINNCLQDVPHSIMDLFTDSISISISLGALCCGRCWINVLDCKERLEIWTKKLATLVVNAADWIGIK